MFLSSKMLIRHDISDGLHFLGVLLQEEHDTFCDISDRMMEEKEKEMVKLNEENRNLSRLLEQRQRVSFSSISTCS